MRRRPGRAQGGVATAQGGEQSADAGNFAALFSEWIAARGGSAQPVEDGAASDPANLAAADDQSINLNLDPSVLNALPSMSVAQAAVAGASDSAALAAALQSAPVPAQSSLLTAAGADARSVLPAVVANPECKPSAASTHSEHRSKRAVRACVSNRRVAWRHDCPCSSR